MKNFALFFLLLVAVRPTIADNQVEPLKVKPKTASPTTEVKAQPAMNAFDDADFRREESFPNSNSILQLSAVTPLGQEIFPEKRFRAWGDLLTLSLALSDLGRKTSLHTEFGAGFTLIRVSLSQPATSFSHTYLFFPVRARLVYTMSRHLLVEGFAGVVLRPWEFDSRPTTDGGSHTVKTNWLTADFGAGMTYVLTNSFFLRLTVGFQHLGLGGGLFL